MRQKTLGNLSPIGRLQETPNPAKTASAAFGFRILFDILLGASHALAETASEEENKLLAHGISAELPQQVPLGRTNGITKPIAEIVDQHAEREIRCLIPPAHGSVLHGGRVQGKGITTAQARKKSRPPQGCSCCA
jgi:hypothetical protein